MEASRKQFPTTTQHTYEKNMTPVSNICILIHVKHEQLTVLPELLSPNIVPSTPLPPPLSVVLVDRSATLPAVTTDTVATVLLPN